MGTKHDRQAVFRLLKLISAALIALIVILVFTNLSSFSGVFRALMQVLSSVLYGFLFAYLLNPLVRGLDKRLRPFLLRRGCGEKAAWRVSRVAGIVFAFAVAGMMVYALIVMIVPQLAVSIRGIVSSMPAYYKSIEGWVLNILEDNPEIKNWADMALEKGYVFLEDFIKNDLLGSVQKIVVAGFAPDTADRIMNHGRQIDKIFNGFIIGKLIDSLIIGILCYIGLVILRMPYAVLIATIVGVTNIIPYFGPILGTIPCAVLILLDDPLKCFYFVIFVLVLQQIDGNIIGPRILGENVGISGFWILVSITVGGGLFGFVGMLLGVPVFAVIYMLVSDGVDRALVRKGKPTGTKAYYSIRTVEDLAEQSDEEQESVVGEPPEQAPKA